MNWARLILPSLVVVAAGCTGSTAEPVVTTTTTEASTTTTTEDPRLFDGGEVLSVPELEGYDLVLSMSAGKMIDNQRQDAVGIGLGMDRSGEGPDLERSVERVFSGDDSDIVVVPVAPVESQTLNPAGTQFAFQAVGVVLDGAQHDILTAGGSSFSWNVIQRGLAGNPGGQWKMSLVVEGDGSVKAQCVVRDEENRLIRVNSSSEIEPDVEATITCLFDDRTNELRVDLNGRLDAVTDVVRKNVDGREAIVFDPSEDVLDEAFGDSDPNGGATCAGEVPEEIGNIITIGNKPACGITLTDDDRFQGTIRLVQLWKRIA